MSKVYQPKDKGPGVKSETVNLLAEIARLKAENQRLKQASQTHHVQQELLSMGEEITQTATWMWNPTDNTLMYSDQLLKLYELDKEEVTKSNIVQKLVDRIHPEDRTLMLLNEPREDVENDYDFSLLPFEHHFRIIMPDERVKWFRIKNAKVLENGVVVGITQDVTLSKELESVKNERKLLLAGEKAAKTGSFIMNVKTKEVTYSQGLIHVLDLPEKGIHSKNLFEKFLERVYPGEVYKVMDGIKMGLRSKKWVEKEYRVLDRHGDVRYILSRCMKYQMPHVIVGIFTDITAEKAIRERISNIQQKLNRQRKLMLQGEELAKMATYTQYLDTGEIEVSPAFLDIFEIPIDKRKNPELLEYYYTLIHPEDLSILKDYSQKKHHLYEENTVTSIEYRLILPGNRIRWVLSRNISGETPNVVMGTMQDITELKTFHLKLEETQKELEQFIYLVSHDLRAPIRHILSYSQWLELKQSDRLAEQGKDILGYVITAAERMGKMVDKLLDYSRTRNLVPHLQTFNLQKTIKDICRKQEEQVNLIPINWEIDPLPNIYADKEMMEQVFENLISNAVKFSSTKDEAFVKIKVETTDEQHIFSISDQGVGFPPEYTHKLFKIFQRLHDDDYPGSGIGLASVHRIIHLHGGEIWADSEPGKGATFTFTLPIH